MIERCGDRQRKCDGLEKWSFDVFIESLSIMLQSSVLLLGCGLSRYMWSINTSVARILISLTGVGVMFYLAIVIAGMSSYACPFQTPLSVALRGPFGKFRHWIVSTVHFKRVLSRTNRTRNRRVRRGIIPSVVRAFSRTRRMWNRRARRQSLPTIPLEDVQVQQPELVSMPDNAPQSQSLMAPDSAFHPEPWLKPKDLAIIHQTNANDALCVSWIIRNITDPEVLDAAIRLSGEIRWFDDGTNVYPPYDTIVSAFEACFDSTGRLHPNSRDTAYYSGRAIMWIRTLAMCKSEEFARMFSLPDVGYTTLVPDPDLDHLLQANSVAWDTSPYTEQLLSISPDHTPSHSQWISNILLHHSWANWTELDYDFILHRLSRAHDTKTAIPLNVILNRLLVWCIFLGSPVEEEALKVQDKSYDIS
jgi:hypothetical protein